MATASPESQIHITAVIVLYQKLPSESETYQTLQAAIAKSKDSTLNFKLLLADNTPDPYTPLLLPPNVHYRAAPRNEGLAVAYNWALRFAEQNHSKWLLTLDQDTLLPSDFLVRLASLARQVALTPMIAAIVPQIISGDRIVSPYRFRGGVVPDWLPRGIRGILAQPIFAFNSGAMLRVSAVRQVGGYDPWFWLDNSDAFLFHQLHRFGKRVLVAGDICVKHNFSMQDLRGHVSPARYHNILLAESAFWDQCMNTPAGWDRTARLLLRAMRHIIRKDPPDLRAITSEFLKRRLVWSRERRIAAWKCETEALFPEVVRPEQIAPSRPKVSVCMATYNSARFVEQQIRSILPQLSPKDEIIIVDDASTDDTRDVIRSIRSPIIHLICHPDNRGVVATFEESLRNATGDIIFLSDGDDIWAPDKVDLFLDVFNQNPLVDIVTSQISFIDGNGTSIETDLYRHRKVFKAGFWANLLHNHFQGSAMALRASRLHTVLPFPTGVLFLHDHWIGMRNALAGSTAIRIEQPLLLYRRHGQNLSGTLSRGRQIKLRLQLLRAHMVAVLKDRV